MGGNMQLKTAIINSLNEEIKRILNLHNIVDFKSEKIKDIGLNEFNARTLVQPEGSRSEHTLILNFLHSGSIKEEHVHLINISSIIKGNNLASVISEMLSGAKNVVAFVQDQLEQTSIFQPDRSHQFKRLEDEISSLKNAGSNNPEHISDFERKMKALNQSERNEIKKLLTEGSKYFHVLHNSFDPIIEKMLAQFKKTKKKNVFGSATFFGMKYNLTLTKEPANPKIITADLSNGDTPLAICFADKKSVAVTVFAYEIASDAGVALPDLLASHESYFDAKVSSLFFHEIHHGKNKHLAPKNPATKNMKRFEKQGGEPEGSYFFEHPERQARLTQYIAYVREYFRKSGLEQTFQNAVQILDSDRSGSLQSDWEDKHFRQRLLREMFKIWGKE